MAAVRNTPPGVDAAFTDASRRGAAASAQRRQGVQGGRIAPHRSMIGLRASPSLLLDLIVLPAILLVTVFVLLEPLMEAWRTVMEALRGPLDLGTAINTVVVDLAPSVAVAVPVYNVDGMWPSNAQLIGSWVFTIVLAVVGATLRGAYVPLGYLLRALAIMQIASNVWFMLAEPPFPYSLSVYGSGLLVSGVVILLLAPFLVGATFFVFDFPPAQEAGPERAAARSPRGAVPAAGNGACMAHQELLDDRHADAVPHLRCAARRVRVRGAVRLGHELAIRS